MVEKQVERDLWALCEQLRPRMEASDYKHVVLRIYSLLALSNKSEEEPGRIKISPEYKWDAIYKRVVKLSKGDGGGSKSAAIYVDQAMTQIAKDNEKINDCFPPVFERLMVDNKTLENLMAGFGKIIKRNEHSGTIYQFFLRKFAETEGRSGGEFFTPGCILDVMVRILDFKEGTIYEPCFGGGSMIVACNDHAKRQTKKKRPLKFYAQEGNPTTFRQGKVRFFLEDIEGEWRLGDTLLEDQFVGYEGDGAIANPPFNQKKWSEEKPEVLAMEGEKPNEVPVDPRWKDWGLPPSANGNFAWMQHVNFHAGKRAGIIFSNGTLSNGASQDNRRKMIAQDRVMCIVAMPNQLFTNTPIPSAIWFIGDKQQHRKGQTLFIDARKKGSIREDSRTLKVLSDEEKDEIVSPVLDWENNNGNYEPVPGQHISLTIDEILERNKGVYCNPGRFVEADDEGDVVCEDDVTELLDHLGILHSEIDELQKSIVDSFDEDV